MMKYVILMILALVITSCSIFDGNDKNNPDTEKPLLPLAVGNWWEYDVINPGWTNPLVGTFRETVSGQMKGSVDGELYTVWAWNTDMDWGHLPEFRWLSRNGEQGLYQMGGVADTDTLFVNNLEYKYPANVGESWQHFRLSFSRSDFNFYVSDTLHITLLDTDREIETPAGTFSCYVYNYQVSMGDDVLDYFDYYMFFSPGTGLIMQEERGLKEQNILSRMILTGYHLVQ